MTDHTTDLFKLHHPETGIVLDTWVNAAVRESFTDPLGSFDFEAHPGTAQDAKPYQQVKRGDFVVLEIAGHQQQVGIIQSVSRKLTRNGGIQFRYSGRTPLVTAYQATIDTNDYNVAAGNDTVASELVKPPLSRMGYLVATSDEASTNLSVKTGKAVGGTQVRDALVMEELKAQDAQPHDNETVYAYCARILTRLGVGLTCYNDGTLGMQRPHYDSDPLYAISTVSDWTEGENVPIEIEVVETNDDQFSQITVRGQRAKSGKSKRAAGPEATVTAEEYAKLKGDGTILPYRSGTANLGNKVQAQDYKPLFLKDKNARDAAFCKNVALLAYGLRAQNAYQVRCTMKGFWSKEGNIWTIDSMASLYAPHIDAYGSFWILERTFRISRQDGPVTDLVLLPKGFLVIGQI